MEFARIPMRHSIYLSIFLFGDLIFHLQIFWGNCLGNFSVGLEFSGGFIRRGDFPWEKLSIGWKGFGKKFNIGGGG